MRILVTEEIITDDDQVDEVRPIVLARIRRGSGYVNFPERCEIWKVIPEVEVDMGSLKDGIPFADHSEAIDAAIVVAARVRSYRTKTDKRDAAAQNLEGSLRALRAESGVHAGSQLT